MVDEDFLKGVLAAELVDFMMNLIENPNFVIVDSVVLDCLLSQIFAKSVDHLNLLEYHVDTTGSTTGYIVDFVSLQGHLDHLISGEDWHHCVPARFFVPVDYSATTEVNADVAFRDLVKTVEHE